MKKKITSLILIVAMLLLPFSMLLNVKAEAVTKCDDIYGCAGTMSMGSDGYEVKWDQSIPIMTVLPMHSSDMIDILEHSSDNQLAFFAQNKGNFGIDSQISLMINFDIIEEEQKKLTNAHAHESIYKKDKDGGIINYEIYELIGSVTLRTSENLYFDYSDVRDSNFKLLTMKGENSDHAKYYRYINNGDTRVPILTVKTKGTTECKIYDPAIISVSAYTRRLQVGEAEEITMIRYYIKDASIDIGANITKDEVEVALSDYLDEPTNRQKLIQQAIGKEKVNVSIYSYGIKINNINTSNQPLNNGVFQIYSDPECTEPIGEPFTGISGVASFVGVSGNYDLCIKQIKAPSGYKKYNKLIHFHPLSAMSWAKDWEFEPSLKLQRKQEFIQTDLNQDNYYELTIINEASTITTPIIIIFIGICVILILEVIIILKYHRKKINKHEKQKKKSK